MKLLPNIFPKTLIGMAALLLTLGASGCSKSQGGGGDGGDLAGKGGDVATTGGRGGTSAGGTGSGGVGGLGAHGGAAGQQGSFAGGLGGHGGGTGGGTSPDGGTSDAAADAAQDRGSDTSGGGGASDGGTLLDGSTPSDGGTPSDAATQAHAFSQLSVLAGSLGGPGNVDGLGSSARFRTPQASTYDGAGNLFVVETGNFDVRKVVMATGQVTTLAGGGVAGTVDGIGRAARFAYPSGITSDRAGNLYVADVKTVRKIVVATGAVTTLAGTPNGDLSQDGTGSGASFTRVGDIVFAGAGTLYVSDDGHIRKVTTTGEVTTPPPLDIDTNPTSSLGADALASDGAGMLYVGYAFSLFALNTATQTVRRIAGESNQPGLVNATGAAARFSTLVAGCLSADAAGNLYVADSQNQVIRKVVLATGEVTTVAGTPGVMGNVDGVGAAAQFSRPFAVTADGTSNLYVSDMTNNTLRKILVNGTVTTLAGLAAHPGLVSGAGATSLFRAPSGVAADERGNIYVMDNNLVRKIAAGTGLVTNVSDVVFKFNGPGHPGLTVDGAGNLFATELADRTVRQIVLATGTDSVLAGTAGSVGNVDGVGAAARFGAPAGITSDHAGKVYVVDGSNRTVRQIVVSTGEVTTLAGGGAADADVDAVGLAASFKFPAPPRAGIAWYGGELFVADGIASIRRINVATRSVTTLAGQSGTPGTADGIGAAARFTAPVGIAADGAGNLLVTEGERLRRISIATGAVTTLVGVPGIKGVVPGSLPAGLNGALSVAVLPDGTAAVSDMNENAVLLVR